MIIQGDDHPIVIEKCEEVAKATWVLAELFAGSRKLKAWNKDEMTIGTNGVIALPLTQEETLAFPIGAVKLEVKWRGEPYMEFNVPFKLLVVARQSKEVAP